MRDAGFALALLLLAHAGCSEEEDGCDWCQEGVICDRVVVIFEEGVSVKRIEEINSGVGGEVIYADRPTSYYVLQLPEGLTVCEALGYYDAKEEVYVALPDTVIYLTEPADDGAT